MRSTAGPTCGRCGNSASAGSSDRARWDRCAPTSAPGDLVVLDQLIDRTWGREDTYLAGDVVEHVSFADPYCPELRLALVLAGGRRRPSRETGREPGGRRPERPAQRARRGRTEPGAGSPEPGAAGGPPGRCTTGGRWWWSRAPAFRPGPSRAGIPTAGVDVINMTQYPEAYLARELGLCYAGLALVTDRDVGVEGDPDRQPVTMEAAMAVLAANVEQTRRLLSAVVPTIPLHPGCRCRVSGAPSLRR